jgi:hypothetical protein
MSELDEFGCVDICMQNIENFTKANMLFAKNPWIAHNFFRQIREIKNEVKKYSLRADILLGAGGNSTYYTIKFAKLFEKEYSVYLNYLKKYGTLLSPET